MRSLDFARDDRRPCHPEQSEVERFEQQTTKRSLDKLEMTGAFVIPSGVEASQQQGRRRSLDKPVLSVAEGVTYYRHDNIRSSDPLYWSGIPAKVSGENSGR